MKLVMASVTFWVTLISIQIFSGQSIAWIGVESSIEGFQLRHCQKEGSICLNVKAPKAEGSQLAQIYYMKDMTVEVSDKKTGTTKVVRSKKGYVDLANNQVVALEQKGTRTVERIYKLEK